METKKRKRLLASLMLCAMLGSAVACTTQQADTPLGTTAGQTAQQTQATTIAKTTAATTGKNGSSLPPAIGSTAILQDDTSALEAHDYVYGCKGDPDTIIRTPAEYSAFLENHPDYATLIDPKSIYDEAFFANYAIAVVTFEHSSSETDFQYKSFETSGKELKLIFHMKAPEGIDQDRNILFCMIRIEKSKLPAEVTEIKVSTYNTQTEKWQDRS